MMLSLGLSLSALRRPGGEATFDPATLFAGGESGVLWLPGADNGFQNDDGTTAAGSGDPLGYITDASGNGIHGTQSVIAEKPTLRQTAGGLWYIERDAVDDGLGAAIDLDGSRWTAAMAYVPDGEDFMVVTEPGSFAPWAGVGTSGSASTTLTSPGVTQNALYFDNALSTETTQGGQYTLAQSASRIVVDFSVAAASGWSSIQIGRYAIGTTRHTPGNIYGFLLIDRELTGDERSDLDTFFAARLP